MWASNMELKGQHRGLSGEMATGNPGNPQPDRDREDPLHATEIPEPSFTNFANATGM